MASAVGLEVFSPAERSALRLDGDCFALGLTVVPVDVPVGPEVRAAALETAVTRYGLIADRWTAAWVHGAWPVLPNPLTLGVDVREGRRTRALVPAPREARFVTGDVTLLGGVRVTSALKTATDLLRLHDRPDPRAEQVARALLISSGLHRDEAVVLADAAPRYNGKRDVVARVRALCPE